MLGAQQTCIGGLGLGQMNDNTSTILSKAEEEAGQQNHRILLPNCTAFFLQPPLLTNKRTPRMSPIELDLSGSLPCVPQKAESKVTLLLLRNACKARPVTCGFEGKQINPFQCCGMDCINSKYYPSIPSAIMAAKPSTFCLGLKH
eukprot:1056990-Pelagomonas_calceolata.AAC.3